MHILFVHQNYPGQFGHIARHLARQPGMRCSFVSQLPPGRDQGVTRIQYKPVGGATRHNSYFTRTFENCVSHAQGVYEACARNFRDRPDLIVGHSGFGSTLFLRHLYNCPILNYFEYYYRTQGCDLDFRPEFPAAPADFLRARCRNAMILLDLENCDAGYSPTRWQRGLFPAEFRPKIDVIFDGVEADIWRRTEGGPREVAGRAIPEGTRVVTYVARGFESMRGFDIFMKVARRIYQQRPDVLFVVVGEDKIAYGGDLRHIKGKSFKEHVLAQGDYDLSKFHFTGRLPAAELARVLSLGDMHIYLTVPFVLSWSLFDAMACGCTIVSSSTPPVMEMIRHGENGLLADFHDVEGLADLSLRVLRDPEGHRPLGRTAAAEIEAGYTLEKTLPRMRDLYRRVLEAAGKPSSSPPRPAPTATTSRPQLSLATIN